jgi:FkbM family methyltransferase
MGNPTERKIPVKRNSASEKACRAMTGKISHAQNFEDVMLWRAFGHLRRGFYIDAGAGDPDDLSVTRLFYEHGWHGINIEPNATHFARLSLVRTRDVNLPLALSDCDGRRPFFKVHDNDDISTLREDIAELHKNAGWEVDRLEIDTTTLAAVCRRHAINWKIHFLKIDAEGSESAILAGAELMQFRPQIIVIEATVPNSTIEMYTEWEPPLLSNAYRFAWFDGLNRFYIAQECWEELNHHFKTPPNVFDGFLRAADLLKPLKAANEAQSAAENQIVVEDRRAAEAVAAQQAAEASCSAAVRAAEDAGRRAAMAEALAEQARAAKAQTDEWAAGAWRRTAIAEAKAAHAATSEATAQGWLQATRASTSWRLTAPLRGLTQLVRDCLVRPTQDRNTMGSASCGPPAAAGAVAQPTLTAGRAPVALSTVTYRAAYKDRRTVIGERRITGCGGRILFDISTSLAWRGAHAVGILRTERELAARLLDDPDLEVLPVVFHDQALRVLDPELARSIVTVDAVSLQRSKRVKALPVSTPPSPQLNTRPLRARMIAPAARALRACARTGLRVVPESARDEVRQLLIHARQAIRNRIYAPQDLAEVEPQPPASHGPSTEPPPDLSLVVYPNENDVLFCAGLDWDVIDWALIGTLRRACRLRIVSMVYDLIPVKFPEMLGRPTSYYANYFLHILDECDLALCISECTRQDLLEFAAQAARPKPAAEVVRLGANVPATPSADEFGESGLRDRLTRGRFALSVGTFETRKNYKLLIDLWHELVDDETFDLDLLIVGMAGWSVEEVVDQLRTSPLFGSRIFWMQDISDAGLSWLYELCHVFLFPSQYEGWGLPVVEALQHGRPVIASNRGAVPEAGLGLADHIDPDDRQAWRQAIIAAAQSARRYVVAQNIPSWDHTANAVKRHLLHLLNAVERPV